MADTGEGAYGLVMSMIWTPELAKFVSVTRAKVDVPKVVVAILVGLFMCR